MATLLFWIFVKHGILLHYHFSQVHSELDEYDMLGSHLLVKYICLKIIRIWYDCAKKKKLKKYKKKTKTKTKQNKTK